MSTAVNELFAFTNMHSKDTNIGTVIQIQFVPDDKKLSHDIRLKAIPNSNKVNVENMCDVIFNRKDEITEIKANTFGITK